MKTSGHQLIINSPLVQLEVTFAQLRESMEMLRIVMDRYDEEKLLLFDTVMFLRGCA